MSFKKYISEFQNLEEFSKEQKLVLIAGKEFENLNFVLKNNNIEEEFKNFKTKENKFSYDFIKDNETYNLTIQNKKDGNFEISISTDKRSTSEEIKLDNYLKNNEYNSLELYIKERIKNIENDPLFINDSQSNHDDNNIFRENIRLPEPKINNINLNFREMNNNDKIFNNINDNNNDNNNFGRNFGNIGYTDLHGDLPNFIPGYDHSFGRPRGNLMGREDFGNFGMGIGSGIRYDPITPFGPKFDFIPQYDGPMKKPGGMGMGIPGGNMFGGGFGRNNFGGGGGFNSFI